MTTEPIAATEAKRHSRIADDDPYVADVESYITAARQHVEQYLNASIVSQTRTHVLDGFPVGSITLPNGPVTGVTSIAYTDTDGNAATVAAHVRSFDTISPVYGAAWPTARQQIGAVTITYTAGMMTGSPLVLADKDIRAGILLVFGDLWDNREAQIIGVSTVINPTLERLLFLHRRQLGV